MTPQRIATAICVVAGVLSMYLRHVEGRSPLAAAALLVCITAGVAAVAIPDLRREDEDHNDEPPGEEGST